MNLFMYFSNRSNTISKHLSHYYFNAYVKAKQQATYTETVKTFEHSSKIYIFYSTFGFVRCVFNILYAYIALILLSISSLM